jgi:hypothetical protein
MHVRDKMHTESVENRPLEDMHRWEGSIEFDFEMNMG